MEIGLNGFFPERVVIFRVFPVAYHYLVGFILCEALGYWETHLININAMYSRFLYEGCCRCCQIHNACITNTEGITGRKIEIFVN